MSTAENKKIFIVEDNLFLSLFFQRLIEKSGYEVAGVATKGNEAVEKFTNSDPDLIIMDIGLDGDMDGVEVAKAIRQDYDTPIIFLTGKSDLWNEFSFNADEAYTDYLIKPVSAKELSNSISKALRLSGSFVRLG